MIKAKTAEPFISALLILLIALLLMLASRTTDAALAIEACAAGWGSPPSVACLW